MNAVELDRPGEALSRAAERVVALLRSNLDPGAHAVGAWSVAEVSLHLSQAWMLLTGLATEDLSRAREVLPNNPEAGSILKDMWDLSDLTTGAVTADPERDLSVIADRIEASASGFPGALATFQGKQDLPWLVEGVRVPRTTFICHLLNETIVHGDDIARASQRDWHIEPTEASLVLEGFLIPVVSRLPPRAMVDQEAARGVHASYEIRIRGAGRYHFLFDDGSLTIEDASARKIDCRISADPTALLMVIWGRESQYKALARGKLFAWGRKPWLGPKLRAFLRNP